MAVSLKDLVSGFSSKIDSFGSIFSVLKGKNGNNLALAAGDKVADNQEGILIHGVNDSASIPIKLDRMGNIMSGNSFIEFSELSDGTTINLQKWVQSVSGFAQAQTVAGINLTSTGSVAVNAYSILTSQAFFQKSPRVPLQVKIRLNWSFVTNSYGEFGFGSPVTNTQLTQGAFWRSIANVLVPVVANSSGLEIVGNSVDISSYASQSLIYDIVMDDDGVLFTIQDSETDNLIYRQSIQIPKSWVKMFQAARVQLFLRAVNGASAPSVSPIFRFSELCVIAHHINFNRSFEFNQSINRMSSTVNPLTGATTANGVNSTAPASAVLSNMASGYAATFLDGDFQFAAVAGAETDYCLFGFTVPTGYRLVIEGAAIEAFNMGAAVAATPTLLKWELGENGASANLATGGHLRHKLGNQSFPIGAVPGTDSNKIINIKFNGKPIIESGRNLALILRMPVATATASQIIRGTYKIHGYFI